MESGIVVPCYNRANIIGRAVESVQTRHSEIGNASSWKMDLPAIRSSRCGRVRLTNAAGQRLATVSQRFMALLDSDDVWLPEKLARQVAAVMMIAADGGGCNAATDIACVYGSRASRSSPMS